MSGTFGLLLGRRLTFGTDVSASPVARRTTPPLPSRSYIKHVRETAPSGSTQSSLLIPLLERATKALLTDETFAQDIRYVRLWIAYSRLVERKSDVFQFLLDRGIGVEWGVFYEEYAVVLESMGRCVSFGGVQSSAVRELTPLDAVAARIVGARRPTKSTGWPSLGGPSQSSGSSSATRPSRSG